MCDTRFLFVCLSMIDDDLWNDGQKKNKQTNIICVCVSVCVFKLSINR